MKRSKLTLRHVFHFWLPLAVTWLMMAAEGPFLASVIARLVLPKPNLAAWGVAISLAWIVEAPVIMLLSTATALVRDRSSFLKLRQFMSILNGLVTLGMMALALPPVFSLVASGLIGLPPDIARLVHGSVILLLPWPASIGYRRFYQGVMIRSGQTRRVAYGTVARLSTMGLVALAFSWSGLLPGALVGAAALSAGVVFEAAATRWMANQAVRRILAGEDEKSGAEPEPLTFGFIVQFYVPLALTCILAMAVQPAVSFFLGRAPRPIESLAVLPVVNALTFLFRCLGMSFTEVAVALMGEDWEGLPILRRFASLLGVGSSLGLALIAFTPLSGVWFRGVVGLASDMADYAAQVTRIVVLMPALEVLVNFQRAILVTVRRTRPATVATCIEVSALVAILFLSTRLLGWPGAIGAGTAYVLGRLMASGYLFLPLRQVFRSSRS